MTQVWVLMTPSHVCWAVYDDLERLKSDGLKLALSRGEAFSTEVEWQGDTLLVIPGMYYYRQVPYYATISGADDGVRV